jgi:hypothetical protein
MLLLCAYLAVCIAQQPLRHSRVARSIMRALIFSLVGNSLCWW